MGIFETMSCLPKLKRDTQHLSRVPILARRKTEPVCSSGEQEGRPASVLQDQRRTAGWAEADHAVPFDPLQGEGPGSRGGWRTETDLRAIKESTEHLKR